MRMKLLASALAVSGLAAVWMVLPGATEKAVPTASSAAVDYFLKIEGVDGESTDDRHKGEIEIESFSWGVSNPSSVGGGGGAGKVQFQDFHFTTNMSKASPKLMLGTATGEHFKNAVLVGVKPGTQQEFFKIKLENVMVTSYNSAGNQGSVPTDSFSLNFTKIEFEYTPQNADGSMGSPVKAGYDLKKGTKV